MPILLPKRRATRIRDWLRGSRGGMALLGLLVGLGAGLGSIVFRELVVGFTVLFSGHHDPSGASAVFNPHLPWLGRWYLVATPILGGLLFGPLISRFAPEAGGHGVPEVMVAVAQRGGRIDPAVGVVKSLASALCIGSGGSVGREGPIVQIGSALGSTLGRFARVPENRLKLLVACGAASGISATFNAPIAGVFFSLELILRSFEAELVAVVLLASVAADVVGRAAFGNHPFLVLPAFALRSYAEYGLYLGLGVLAGGVGLTFTRVLYALEDAAERFLRVPKAMRPAAGGLVLGCILFAVPQLYGVGYPVLQRAIDGRYLIGFLILLLVGKLLATSVTLAIGGSGGVFAPSLFMGAALGTAYGEVVHAALPSLAGPAGAYGIVGMAAVFAAAARAPVTAIVIVFELTNDYRIILPLMLTVVVATGLSSILSRDTIYTLKLRRRGIDLHAPPRRSRMMTSKVREAMRTPPAPIGSEASLDEVAETFAENEAFDALPVVDGDGSLRGVVSRSDLERALAQDEHESTAFDLAFPATLLDPGDTLEHALECLAAAGTSLPVLDPATGLVGWLGDQDVLRIYLRRAPTAGPALAPAAS